MDRRIVEYCLSIPDYQYFKNGWKRYMFRQAAAHILPQEIQWKRMKDDPTLTRQNIALMPGANRQFMDLLHIKRIAIQKKGFVDVDGLVANLSGASGLNGGAGDCAGYVRHKMWLAFIGFEN